MTQQDIMTTLTNPWELAAVYAAAFGLFAPGALMAARQRTPIAAQNAPRTNPEGTPS